MKKLFLLLLTISTFYGCNSSDRFARERGSKPDVNMNGNFESGQILDNTSDLEIEEVNALSTDVGLVAVYPNSFTGKKTMSGEVYKPEKLTLSHRSYPMGTKVRVTNLKNNKTSVVKVNDRFIGTVSRVGDVSFSTAEKLGFLNQGITEVKFEVLSWGR